jgi:hypothetical protein
MRIASLRRSGRKAKGQPNALIPIATLSPLVHAIKL